LNRNRSGFSKKKDRRRHASAPSPRNSNGYVSRLELAKLKIGLGYKLMMLWQQRLERKLWKRPKL